jgi:RNA polymerase sigma-70 factor (ECF subfamily)
MSCSSRQPEADFATGCIVYSPIVGVAGPLIEATYQAAARSWPELTVTFERFREALIGATNANVKADELHAKDLYLALACLDGQPHAIAIFERQIIEPVRPSVEHACRDGKVSAEDVMQSTREKLLVGDGSGDLPKLAQYTGRGSLVGWVRVVAVREALQDRRKSTRERIRDDAALLEGGPPAVSMELALLRQRYEGSFRSAVQQALRRLTAEQRSLLRFHTRDGLTIDQLAPMLGVHRATVARRIERARADALEHTREFLREQHGLSESEARSLCTALGGEVDVSIGRALSDEVPA